MQEEHWISIVDYSRLRGVSISTVRRYIKAGRLEFQENSGKYFIKVPSGGLPSLRDEEQVLREELQKLRSENSELKIRIRQLEGQPHA